MDLMSSYGNLVRIIRNGKLLQHQSLEQRTNLLDLMGIQGILKRKLKLDQRTQVRYMDEYLLIEQFQIGVNRTQLNQKNHAMLQKSKDHRFDTNV